ncbi:hypothetical protein MXD63_29525 [Frankia sp. Cpl3]|uniref:hypothetical protein n=1 Tax=Parafrankia colletiae TaxID=573497 RepID=UPI001F51F458|nr:hypothetical protein [Parafrankia colletiae]MCK9904178.1 hypothetical protein [Frankia sp. Cpl3]
MTQAPRAAGADQADELRAAMADRLFADGWISRPEVEAAFRTVPRHLFMPAGMPLDTATPSTSPRSRRPTRTA